LEEWNCRGEGEGAGRTLDDSFSWWETLHEMWKEILREGDP